MPIRIPSSLPSRAFLCFAFGLISAGGLAPISWPILFLGGFAGFAIILRGAENKKRCMLFAWLYALGFHLAGIYWISASLFIDIKHYIWVLPFSLVALPAYLALIFSLACLLAHRFRTSPLAHALALACLVFFSEILRGWLFSGFPWNLFGYVWTETLPLLQSVSLIGIQGLTLLTLLGACTLSLLYPAPNKAGLLFLAVIGLVFSGLTLWGDIRLSHAQTTFFDNVQLRLVQGAIHQTERRTVEERLEAFERLRGLSRQKTASTPTHIIWSETSSPFLLASDDDAKRALSHIVPEGGALITGTPGREIKEDRTTYYNSLVVLDSKGRITGLYDKTRLVPFGEFVPFRNILKTVPVASDVIGAADFSPGPGPKTLRAPGAPSFSPLICYEAIYSHTVTDPTDPPAWLLQITNDAWFGRTSGPYQHFAMARVRAVEEGLSLVRSANSGISAVVDPWGRVIKQLDLDERGLVESPLPKPTSTKTWFSQRGNVPALVLAFLLLILNTYVFFLSRKG